MDGGFVTLSAIEVAEGERRVRVLAPVPEPKDETRDRYVPLPSDSPAVAAWRQRMGTDQAQDTYKLRAATVECVNAQARTSQGVYQVRVRGRAKVRCVALGGDHAQLAHLAPRRTACRPSLTKQGASQTGDMRL